MTTVWSGDTHAVSWGVTSGGVAVNLTGATVRLIAKNLNGAASVDLTSTFAVDVVTHQLTGTLPVGHYQIVVEATQGGVATTYPDAETGPMNLIVKRDLG